MTAMIWTLLFFIGSLGGLLVGMAGVGSTLVVLPTLIIIFSFMFHSSVSLKLAVGTTTAY